MAGRYLATELQDDNGDVIYPHTEADIVFASDGTTVEENLGGDVTDTEIQEIFGDSDSQLESGKKLSVKEKIKKTLKRYQTLLRMRILDTVEEVEANTDDGYLMGAKAGAALINDLAQQPDFIYDSTGKITGYKSPGGADTVFPFSSGLTIPSITISGRTSGYNITNGTSNGSITLDVKNNKTITFGGVSGSASITLGGGSAQSITAGKTFDISDVNVITLSISSSGSASPAVSGGWCETKYSVTLTDVYIS